MRDKRIGIWLNASCTKRSGCKEKKDPFKSIITIGNKSLDAE
jgi:hypothetical protein